MTIVLDRAVMRAVMALAQHVIVLHHGEVIAQDAPARSCATRAVLECYLGEDTEL